MFISWLLGQKNPLRQQQSFLLNQLENNQIAKNSYLVIVTFTGQWFALFSVNANNVSGPSAWYIITYCGSMQEVCILHDKHTLHCSSFVMLYLSEHFLFLIKTPLHIKLICRTIFIYHYKWYFSFQLRKEMQYALIIFRTYLHHATRHWGYVVTENLKVFLLWIVEVIISSPQKNTADATINGERPAVVDA